MNKDALQITGLRKIYSNGPEELVILKKVEFELKKGEHLVITGDSGSGKSTLLNLIGGLDNFDSGSIHSFGRDIGNLKESELTQYRSSVVGLIFQFHFLLKDFTALENIMLPAFILGKTKKAAIEKALELINAVKLFDRKDHYPVQLSGGERQRIAVARSLINDPEIILADEPTGNLDENNSKIVQELLFDLVDKYNKAMILVTHDRRLTAKGKYHFHLEKGELSRR